MDFFFHLLFLQNAQSMQSLHNVNFDNYGYTMGSSFQDLMNTQRVQNVNNMGDQGLSPPYSNQSPPYSVQSNAALSPQGYIGKLHRHLPFLVKSIFVNLCQFSPNFVNFYQSKS